MEQQDRLALDEECVPVGGVATAGVEGSTDAGKTVLGEAGEDQIERGGAGHGGKVMEDGRPRCRVWWGARRASLPRFKRGNFPPLSQTFRTPPHTAHARR